MPDVQPELSVILVTPERFKNLRRTMRHLRAQTARERIEVVIVAPSEEAIADHEPHELEGFARVTVVPDGPIDNVDPALAPGILRASAPVVAVLEDHAYPDPAWAEALIRAHEGPWTVVGSTVLNANPHSMLSWTNMLIAYGPWTEPNEGREVAALPGHNTSYKRAPLAEYGEALRGKLGRSGGLLDDLKAAGHRFYTEPEARVYHANPSRLASTADLRFNAGRLYGAKRAQQEGWTSAQRLTYIAGGPLIPLVRFKRLREELFGGGKRADLAPQIFPALLLGLALDGAGQMAGYAFGPGPAPDVLATFEMDRMEHLTDSDRRLLEA